MYFKNISDPELNQLPKPYAPNFNIKLSSILHKTSGAFDNKLFRIEEIITDKLYRIYPMFNTKRIESTNPSDQIFENRLIICTKETNETFVTFISDETGEIQDYSNYVTLCSIGDSLTTAHYNGIVQLIRANSSITENIRISTDTGVTDYGDYDFQFTGLVLDNGIEVTDLTTLKCRLSNPVFHYSNYTLNLKVLRITNTNSEDDDETDNKTIIDISTVLTNKEFVDIDTSELQTGDIILYDCTINITHDKPVIPDWIQSIELSANPSIIQSGDATDIYAECLDNGDVLVGSGHTVYFFEKLEPTITMSASADIIQTGDNLELYATVKDEDGSLAKNVKAYFYKKLITIYSNTTEVTHTAASSSTIYDVNMSVDLPNDYSEIHFEIWGDNTSSSSEFRFFLMPKSQWGSGTTQPTEALFIDLLNGKAQFGKRENDTTTYFITNLNCANTTWHEVTFIKNGTSVQFYLDGDLKTTQTISWIDNHSDYCLSMMRWSVGSKQSKIRNVEIG